jgi:hypothetical protein
MTTEGNVVTLIGQMSRLRPNKNRSIDCAAWWRFFVATPASCIAILRMRCSEHLPRSHFFLFCQKYTHIAFARGLATSVASARARQAGVPFVVITAMNKDKAAELVRDVGLLDLWHKSTPWCPIA